jgi:sugar phosphate isomerase/epimerase
MNKLGIGVQLYTVRDLTAKDFAGTVKKVAELGYRNVELAGYGNLKTAQEAKKALGDAGLKSPAGHWAIDVLRKESELQRVMEEAQLLEMQTVVVPFLPADMRKDADAWKRTAALLDEIGSYFHGVGIEVAYHNHAFEFERKYDGDKYDYDILFENTQTHLVKAEIDVYWMHHAGVDPVGYINKFGDRVRLLHLKDMAQGAEKRFAPVGAGTMDFKAILAAAEKNDVRWGMVEQDKTYDTPPLDALRTSIENLKKLGADPKADPLSPPPR